MKRQLVCTAELCSIPFKVYINDLAGGSFDCSAKTMIIGAVGRSERYALGVLLHEAFECVSALKNMRFANPNTYLTHDCFVFHFDHDQFSKACDEVAIFVAKVWPIMRLLLTP